MILDWNMFITLMLLWSKSVVAGMRLASKPTCLKYYGIGRQCWLTLSSLEWLAGAPRWWFNIISQHGWLYALETQHYTAPRRALMLWKTRYYLFSFSSFTWWTLCLQNMHKSNLLMGREMQYFFLCFLKMFGMTSFFFEGIWGKNAVDSFHFC